MTIRKRAQRMSPEQRREQILESAAALIVDRGLSACTLEEVAGRARISKPLIYKYFSRLSDLLKALVEREYQYLRRSGLDIFPQDMPFDELVHRSTRLGIDYLYERGPIIRLLADDRSVAKLARRQVRDQRSDVTDYLIRRRVAAYGIPEDVATIVSTMTVNAPILSVRALRRYGISAQRTADVWNEFMIGGNNAIAAKFGKKRPGNGKMTEKRPQRQKVFAVVKSR